MLSKFITRQDLDVQYVGVARNFIQGVSLQVTALLSNLLLYGAIRLYSMCLSMFITGEWKREISGGFPSCSGSPLCVRIPNIVYLQLEPAATGITSAHW